MSDSEVVTPDELKELNRVMWSLGEYARVSAMLLDGANQLVNELDIRSGQAHLDVATGDGNVALLSAKRGASVTGLDLTSQYFDIARARFRKEDVDVDLVEGDGECLPFPDESFDIVTSTYGIQFAPRHACAAAELARVCRRGGVIGLCNWTARGWTGQFQRIIASYFPPPPAYAKDPMLWGDVGYLARLFGPGFDVRGVLKYLRYRCQSAEALISFFEHSFGPCLIARRSISPPSRWNALREELVEMTEGFFSRSSAAGCVEPEYVLALAHKRT